MFKRIIMITAWAAISLFFRKELIDVRLIVATIQPFMGMVVEENNGCRPRPSFSSGERRSCHSPILSGG
jgi:hypothetical protein